MKATAITATIGLAEAAYQLKIPYQDAHRLLLTGKLEGLKRGGRWYVTVQSIEKLLKVPK